MATTKNISNLDRLPEDILDYILLSLPDFTTLSTALRTSKKHFYAVFQARQRSIVLSVAHNVVGPALPQAVRFAHYRDSELCDEDTTLVDHALNRGICEEIQQNAAHMQRLEDLFSFRNKDRTSTTSKLTQEESFRFRRAAYRFELYCERIKAEICDGEFAYEQLLDSWPTNELLEIDRVACFLQDVARWSYISGTQWPAGWDLDPPDTQCMGDLADILSDWEDAVLPDDQRAWDFLVDFNVQLSKVLSHKNVEADAQTTRRAKAILDTVYGVHDACHRCHTPKGVDLWGRPNWHLLRGALSVPSMIKLLEGNLPRNDHEMSQLADYIHNRDDDDDDDDDGDRLTFDWTNFIEELCDMDIDAEGPWDKDQWYCLDCVLVLLRRRLRKWWIATKVKEGVPFKEDCWYGYNCRTQVHRALHAARLNHLCTPTRGDAA